MFNRFQSCYFKNTTSNLTHASGSETGPIRKKESSSLFVQHEGLQRTRSNGSDSSQPHAQVTKRTSSPSNTKSNESRRSLRRQRYYGTEEFVNATEAVRNTHRFRQEPGGNLSQDTLHPFSKSSIIVENPQSETRWYWKYFLGKAHQNFAGINPETKAPFFLSVLVEEESPGSLCRCILWLLTGPRHLCIEYSRPIPAKALLQKFPGMSDYNRSLRSISNGKIQKDLIVLEDQEGGISCKFGVIYAQRGQSSDVEMLGNEHGSPEFEKFLGLLGQRIQLNGWGNYKGGLDASTNSTGRESIFTTFAQHEIMFHVSTLLPFSSDNKQQVERKRHIGNDIVNIVFESGDHNCEQPSFSPTMMKSHFTHIFAVVTFDSKSGCYRLWVYSEMSVPAYGPPLPCPNEFTDEAQFRELLLTKLINGEKSALQAKAFVEKRERTNESLINDMFFEYLKDSQKSSFSHKMPENMVRHIQTESKHAQELFDFVKFGELMKLEKTLSGDVAYYTPKKLSLLRSQPWEPKLLYANAPIQPERIVASESLGDVSLLLLTDQRQILMLDENQKVHSVSEQAADVQQISILEEFGLILLRVSSGKDSGLSVFPLNDVTPSKSGLYQLISRKQCQTFSIPASKGCNLFTTTDPFGLRLSIVLVFGKRLLLLRWAFGPLGPIEGGIDLTQKFTAITEITVAEEPIVLSAFDQGSNGAVRAAYLTKGNHNQGLFLVDFHTAVVRSITASMASKARFRDIVAMADGSSDEIVFTQDNVTTYIVSEDGTDTTQQIFWSCNLDSMVYRFPFMIGFAHDTVEVRLAINGNLLSSICMARVQLLSAKNNILFASCHHCSPAAHQSQIHNESDSKPQTIRRNTLGSSKTQSILNKQQKENTTIMNCQIYCIEAKNLVSEGNPHCTTLMVDTRSPNKNKCRSPRISTLPR